MHCLLKTAKPDCRRMAQKREERGSDATLFERETSRRETRGSDPLPGEGKGGVGKLDGDKGGGTKKSPLGRR